MNRVIVVYAKESVVEEVISPMLADRDGQILMISTPFGKNHLHALREKWVAATTTGIEALPYDNDGGDSDG